MVRLIEKREGDDAVCEVISELVGCDEDVPCEEGVGALVAEYVAKRDAERYMDELGEAKDPRAAHIKRPLYNHTLDDVLDAWDAAYLRRIVAQGGIYLILNLLSTSERLDCPWLTTIIRIYLADLVRSTPAQAIRTEIFHASHPPLPTTELLHYRWINSVTHGGVP
eukprot:TRINITY_DN38287_c0_g1_i1.p1 TRINITY_DN38287_c0_g1~~TRINITY_DN38287_c0_g1_i1.p1  ORF type:complete len:166 (+),score=43.73 TRINITY_DN38287_c0_g1_i1:67-564(+)